MFFAARLFGLLKPVRQHIQTCRSGIRRAPSARRRPRRARDAELVKRRSGSTSRLDAIRGSCSECAWRRNSPSVRAVSSMSVPQQFTQGAQCCALRRFRRCGCRRVDDHGAHNHRVLWLRRSGRGASTSPSSCWLANSTKREAWIGSSRTAHYRPCLRVGLPGCSFACSQSVVECAVLPLKRQQTTHKTAMAGVSNCYVLKTQRCTALWSFALPLMVQDAHCRFIG